MTKETIFLPFGTRCNSASIIDHKLNKRSASYPFDWIDISLKTMLEFLNMDRNNIPAHISNYLDHVNAETQRHEDGTWFPHDFADPLDVIKEKYIRRFHRLFDLLESDKDIIFLTILPHLTPDSGIGFYKIADKINTIVKGKCTFIAVNLFGKDEDFQPENIIHFYVPLVSWETFDNSIIEKIKNHPIASELFK